MVRYVRYSKDYFNFLHNIREVFIPFVIPLNICCNPSHIFSRTCFIFGIEDSPFGITAYFLYFTKMSNIGPFLRVLPLERLTILTERTRIIRFCSNLANINICISTTSGSKMDNIGLLISLPPKAPTLLNMGSDSNLACPKILPTQDVV